MYPSQEADRLLLRMPDGMRSQIKDRAKAHRRSMNSEAIVLIEAALAAEGKPTTGVSLQAEAPAAGHHETALQGGPITHG